MKVIKHDSNFGSDVRIFIRNSYLGLRIRVKGYGCYMQVFGFRARYRSALNLSQPVSKPAPQPVLKQATFHWSQIGPPISKHAGWPASKWAKLRIRP